MQINLQSVDLVLDLLFDQQMKKENEIKDLEKQFKPIEEKFEKSDESDPKHAEVSAKYYDLLKQIDTKDTELLVLMTNFSLITNQDAYDQTTSKLESKLANRDVNKDEIEELEQYIKLLKDALEESKRSFMYAKEKARGCLEKMHQTSHAAAP